MKKNLTIQTATIEIKVIRVDNHKMTKATFRQIEEKRKNFSVQDILGWVTDNGKIYVVGNEDGCIKKVRISEVVKGGERKKAEAIVKAKFDQLFIAT